VVSSRSFHINRKNNIPGKEVEQVKAIIPFADTANHFVSQNLQVLRLYWRSNTISNTISMFTSVDTQWKHTNLQITIAIFFGDCSAEKL
jgi:hypothetical protein